MVRRGPLIFLVLAVLAVPSPAATYRTTNFRVWASSEEVAERIGEAAERYRKEKAVQWLGKEMPPWRHICPVEVTVTLGGAGGATTFRFEDGRILDQEMRIEGSLDQLLDCVLPHEVTHTVFAHYFHCQPPRWADEGGAVLSEHLTERRRQDAIMRDLLRVDPERSIPLRRLFSLQGYPQDLMAFYVESYSISHFLVALQGRQKYLDFVAEGMDHGWDEAVRAAYRFRDIEDLEDAWVRYARQLKAAARVARPAPAVSESSEEAAPAPAGIKGTLVDETGLKQPQLEVLLKTERGGGVVARTKTDDQGRFTFDDVPPGRYLLAAKKLYSQAEKHVRVEAGQHTKVSVELRH